MLRCDDCVDEFRKQNQVSTAAGATAPLPLLCNQPMISLEDAQRCVTSWWWTAAFALDPDKLVPARFRGPFYEVYDALDQGVVDCTIQTATELTLFRLVEVVSDITVGAPGGGYGGTVLANINYNIGWSLSEKALTGRAYPAQNFEVGGAGMGNGHRASQSWFWPSGPWGIDPRKSRRLLCEWVEDTYQTLPQSLRKPAFGARS